MAEETTEGKNFIQFSETNPCDDCPPDVIQFDLDRFKKLAKHVKFSDDGHVLTIPSWDNIREILKES